MNQKSAIELLIQRDRLWVALGLVAAIALSWIYLVREATAMDAMVAEARMHAAMGMASMTMRAWNASDWLALFVMCAVMMVGMMLPSAAPVIMLVLGAYRLRRDVHSRLASVAFIGGYLTVWTMFGAIAALGQLALHRAAVLSEDMRLHSAVVSGVLLVVAGVYQWLPLKNRCLVQCQAPLAFLTQHWRAGVGGGFSMGVRRHVLRRLLLVADDAAVCARRDEPGVDRGACRDRAAREALTSRTDRQSRGWSRCSRVGALSHR